MSEQNAVKNDLSMAQEISALRSRVAILEEELAFAQDQLSWLKKQIFGRKTEQSSVIMDSLQLSLFPEEQNPQVQPKPETVTVLNISAEQSVLTMTGWKHWLLRKSSIRKSIRYAKTAVRR